MDLHAESLKGLLARIEPDETRNGKLRFPYACGLLARGVLNDTVAYGRSLELDIQVHPGRRMADPARFHRRIRTGPIPVPVHRTLRRNRRVERILNSLCGYPDPLEPLTKNRDVRD